MTKKETAVIIDGKKIDLNEWLEHLTPAKANRMTLKVSISDYSDIGYILNSILVAFRVVAENGTKTEIEEIANLLTLAQDLIPYTELELLSKLQKSIYKN